jgi:hypothetical protein
MGLSKSGLPKHGGKIRVENKVGEGRIFTFVLPLDPKDHIMTGDKRQTGNLFLSSLILLLTVKVGMQLAI